MPPRIVQSVVLLVLTSCFIVCVNAFVIITNTPMSPSIRRAQAQIWAASVKSPGEQGKKKAASKPSNQPGGGAAGKQKLASSVSSPKSSGAPASKKPVAPKAAAAAGSKKSLALGDELAWSLSNKNALADFSDLRPPLSDTQVRHNNQLPCPCHHFERQPRSSNFSLPCVHFFVRLVIGPYGAHYQSSPAIRL